MLIFNNNVFVFSSYKCVIFNFLLGSIICFNILINLSKYLDVSTLITSNNVYSDNLLIDTLFVFIKLDDGTNNDDGNIVNAESGSDVVNTDIGDDNVVVGSNDVITADDVNSDIVVGSNDVITADDVNSDIVVGSNDVVVMFEELDNGVFDGSNILLVVVSISGVVIFVELLIGYCEIKEVVVNKNPFV